MLSRALLLAACLAPLAAADKDMRFTSECRVLSMCGGKEMCCVAGKMDKKQGTCTYTDGTSCYLCTPVDGLSKCDEPTATDLGTIVETGGPMTMTSFAVPPAAGAGAGNGLPPTYPNSGVTLTIGTYDGMAGWLDVEAAKFYNFKELIKGLVATIPSFYTRAGFRVAYSCNSKGLPGVVPEDFKGCDIFLFTYRCPPCNARDGNIGAQLLAMSDPIWYSGTCGPTFKLNAAGYEHPFVVYSAEVEDNTVTTVQLENDVQFMFWAIVGKSVVCQGKYTETECNKFPYTCEWNGESCRWRDCEPIPPFQGPPGGPVRRHCTTCVDDEEAYIPEVIV